MGFSAGLFADAVVQIELCPVIFRRLNSAFPVENRLARVCTEETEAAAKGEIRVVMDGTIDTANEAE